MSFGITSNLSGLTDAGLQEAFIAGVASANADLSWMGFFPFDSTSWDAAMYSPPSPFAASTEGADITPEAVLQAATKSITVSSFSLAYSVSDLAQRTLSRDVMVRLFQQLGSLAVRFFATQCYDLLNNAETSTTTADGVTLINDSHTPTAGVTDNKITGSLSHDTYAEAVQMLADQTDDRGTIMGGRPSRLIVSTDNAVVAGQIMTATTSADDLSQPNIYAGSAGITVAPDMTSSTRWFLFDDAQTTFRCPVVRGPSPWEVTDAKSLNYEVRDLAHAGFGVVDWRGVVGAP